MSYTNDRNNENNIVRICWSKEEKKLELLYKNENISCFFLKSLSTFETKKLETSFIHVILLFKWSLKAENQPNKINGKVEWKDERQSWPENITGKVDLKGWKAKSN